MKKFAYLAIPFMTVSLLASCAKPKSRAYTFNFAGEYCSINGQTNFHDEVIKGKEKTYTIQADECYELPNELSDLPIGVSYQKNEASNATLKFVNIVADCAIKVTATVKQITVDFKPFKSWESIKTIHTLATSSWKDIYDEQPYPYEVIGYDFLGWSLSDTGAGEVMPIDDTTPFRDNITFYGSYNYICYIDEESTLAIDHVASRYGEDLTIYLKVKSSEIDKYELPLTIDAFALVTGSLEVIDKTKCKYNREWGALTIPASEIKDKGVVLIGVIDYQPSYVVKEKESTPYKRTHITFSNTDGGTLINAKKGEPYECRIEAVQDENDTAKYCVSPFANIYINHSQVPLSEYYYYIDIDDNDPTKGTLYISGEAVKGEIELSSVAFRMDGFSYMVEGIGGVKENMGIGLNSSSIFVDGEVISLELERTENDITYPDADHVLVSINSGYPKKIADEPTTSYDPSTGKITVKNEDTNNRSYIFYAVANGYDILEKSSWEVIDFISKRKIADRLLPLGKIKNVYFNNQLYKARLIGFNHDSLADDNTDTAGVTFEFAKLISDRDGHAIKQIWDNKSSTNCNFPESILNKYLNGTEESIAGSVYEMLPNDLRSVIKKVNKKVGLDISYAPTSYQTYLFPLCCEEIGDLPTEDYPVGEGQIYEYYQSEETNIRVKTDFIGNSCNYWLRSPNNDPNQKNKAWGINDGGETGLFDIDYNNVAVAPAFCI